MDGKKELVGGTDPKTRIELKSEAGNADPEATLDTLSGFAAATTLPASQTRSIGPYKLVRKLGEGGMGQVWLAEQAEPVKRTVALKLIRVGLYDEDVLLRFRAERQSLAMMDHPGIAKVFDAGASSDGQPYFVMEYVPGIPITQYCDAKRLTIRQRLELVIKVCEGVQHAHQKAIIHRDLKPANILVSETDGKPIPRIIDFGLAKATGGDSGGDAAFTRAGGFVGTPGYMSPEQADASIRDIDTRTDVYSLGVILYVLLTGAEPFDSDTWRKQPLHEVLRQLREVDPPTPSSKLRGNERKMTTSAEFRSIPPRQLANLLHGDLDWITMKALEKDRTRRYGTPMELASDIERYLNHRAVHAVPPSFTYRAGKFIRRNRLVLGSAAVVALALLAATTVSIRQSIKANRQAAVAQAVSDFLENDLLAQASASNQSESNAKPDPDLKVRTALDRAAMRIAGKFNQQPAVEAAIRDTIGTTYYYLGFNPPARTQLERALELSRKSLGPRHPQTLKTANHLGWVAQAEGKSAEAKALYVSTLDMERRVLGPQNPSTLTTMSDLATVYDQEGEYPHAETLYRESLEIQRRVLGPDHRGTLATMANLAWVYSQQGKYSEAETLGGQTVEVMRRVLGPEHPYTLATMGDLAFYYTQQGKFGQAETLASQSLEIQRRLLGPEHPDTLAAMSNLAWNYSQQGKYAQAETLFNQALNIERRILGPEHPNVLEGMVNLAECYGLQGKYTQAEMLFSQTIEIRKRVQGLEHPDTATTAYSWSYLEARRGLKDRAFTLLYYAVDHGLPPANDLAIEKDTELTSLKSDPRWIALVVHAKQIAALTEKAPMNQSAK